MLSVLQTDEHPSRSVDPFSLLPCDCPRVWVHITDGASMGDDLVECPKHRWVVTLVELYRGMAPPQP